VIFFFIATMAKMGAEKLFFGYIRQSVSLKTLAEIVAEIYKPFKNFEKHKVFFELLFKAQPLAFNEATLKRPEFAEIVSDLPFVKQIIAKGVLKTNIKVALNALTSEPPSTISYITLLTGFSEKKIFFL
jgi:hypothetical protein